jgi:hypothetical protein
MILNHRVMATATITRYRGKGSEFGSNPHSYFLIIRVYFHLVIWVLLALRFHTRSAK